MALAGPSPLSGACLGAGCCPVRIAHRSSGTMVSAVCRAPLPSDSPRPVAVPGAVSADAGGVVSTRSLRSISSICRLRFRRRLVASKTDARMRIPMNRSWKIPSSIADRPQDCVGGSSGRSLSSPPAIAVRIEVSDSMFRYRM